MAPPAEDYYCSRFQPNSFDSSRCGACLRPDHMHLMSSTSPTAAAQQDGSQEWVRSCIVQLFGEIIRTIKYFLIFIVPQDEMHFRQ